MAEVPSKLLVSHHPQPVKGPPPLMITREDDVDAHALHRGGWTISAIARHLGHDRKTIRAYLQGGRVAGERRRAEPDAFESFVGYCRERLGAPPPTASPPSPPSLRPSR